MSESNDTPRAETNTNNRYEIIIVTLSNGHIIPIMLDKSDGKSWQGHLVGGNLSWRHITEYDETNLHSHGSVGGGGSRRMDPYR